MIRKIAVVAVASAFLAGCQTASQPSGTLLGAGGGALAGAALGTLAGGDDRRNALIGAGVGALAGAAIGTYLDQQQQALAQDLQGTGATVERQGDTLLVTIPGDVTFAFDSAQIQPQFFNALNQVAGTLSQNPQSYINVIGHTDSTGAASYNQGLSERRAQSVANYLISQGVNPARVVAVGRGETQPVADNSTEFGRQQNRRVELQIIPFTG